LVIKLKKGPVTELKESLEKTKAEVKTHYENYLRALAEFENFRRRKEKEIEEFRCFANENLMFELIPVLENFERALAYKDVTKDSESLKNGLEIAYRQMKTTLAKFGLKEYSCLGQEFDPKTCEAISFIETEENPKNVIVQELSKGYEYQNRVIQPARVIVTKPKSEKDLSQHETEEKSRVEEQDKGV